MPETPTPDVDAAKTGPELGHLERKSDGFVEARFTARPAGALPLDLANPSSEAVLPASDSRTTDVAALPDDVSVWEARARP